MIIILSLLFGFHSNALADQTTTEQMLAAPTVLPVLGDPSTFQSKSQIRHSHVTRGLIALPLIGYELASGFALSGQEPNPAIFMRQSHMVANIGLLGLALYDLDDLLSLKKTKPQDKTHRLLGYGYLGTITLSALAGLIQVRTYGNRDSSAVHTWNAIHTGLGVLAASALIGSAFTVHFN